MPNISVPNIVSFSRLSRLVTDIKTQSDTARTESVTGLREDITAATKGDVGSAHLAQKAVDDVVAYQELLTIARTRAERTQLALGQLGGEAVRLGSETLAAVSREDENALSTLAADARAAIYSVFSTLNTTDGGRAIFGGDVTDRPPLVNPDQLLADIEAIVAGATDAADAETQIDFYFNDPAGGFATSIYQGGTGAAGPVELAPGVRLDVSATAADQPIKDLIKSFAVMATQGSAGFPDATPLIEFGAGGALIADVNITEMRSTIGAGEARIQAALERYEAEESVLTAILTDKIGRDQFEAATELQNLENQLEASYLLSARLARLTIADYLR